MRGLNQNIEEIKEGMFDANLFIETVIYCQFQDMVYPMVCQQQESSNYGYVYIRPNFSGFVGNLETFYSDSK